MSTQLKLRRGTTAQHSTFTGASGEVTVDTDKKAIVVHDGATAGGYPQVSNQPTTRPSIRPSLLLDFANTKQLDPRVTFSRASTGAYYDGKTVVKAEENLILYSQEFDNAAWTKQAGSITANATTAPDGTSTADTFTASASIGVHAVLQTATALVSGRVASVYVKAGTHRYVQISFNGDATAWANFDVIAGAGVVGSVGTNQTASIIDSGNGWYRCVVYTTSTTATNFYFAVVDSSTSVRQQSWNTAGTETVYIWGAQLEQRSTATAYTPTTTAPITNYIPAMQTAAANVARFDHDPVTGESKGLLIEEQRTNLLTASQDFDAPLWTRANVNIHANCAIAPDGTFTADRMLDTSITNGFTISRGVSVSASTAYSFSIYAKASGRPDILLELYGFGGGSAWFNLQTGVVTSLGSTYSGSSNLSASIQPSGNGWYRCTLTLTTASSGSQLYPQVRLLNNAGSSTYTGDGYSGIYIWGAQLEAGAFATSYIPTPLTYTGRASTATYKAADGTIRTAQPNVARYEPNAAGGSNLLLEGAASNLLTYSGESSKWTGQGSLAILQPEGLFTPLSIATTLNYHRCGPASITLNSGTTYSLSVYAKAGTTNTLRIELYGDGANTAIVNGTIGGAFASSTTGFTSVGTPVSEHLGGGLYKVSCAVTPSTTLSNYALAAGPGSTSGQSVLLYGFQLETGSVATSYIPSVETHTGRSATVASYYDSTGIIRYAGSGVPRYTYNPSNLNAAPKLLLEPAATNLILQSQFSIGWSTNGGTSTFGTAVTSPDGSITALPFNDSSNTAAGYCYQSVSFTSGAAYSMSVYVKKGTATNFALLSFTQAGQAVFNIATGTISSTSGIASNASITSVGNGWYRCSVTFTANATASNNVGFGDYDVANTGDLFTIWGAQLETGYAPTSYIQTTSAQVTRAADTSTSAAGSRAADVYSSSQVTRSADSASMTGTNFSSWFRQDEGTVYCEANAKTSGTSLVIDDGSYSNRLPQLGVNTAYVVTSGTLVASLGGASTLNQLNKNAFSYAVNDYALCVNGGSAFTDPLGNLPSNISRIVIGADSAFSVRTNGTIKRIAYYPKRLSNTELQAITS